ncbi:hypothetical protein J6590_028548 [Homalodisca vitripennis]|nr:hypothetical protein J6590_028548 [Homalodisca vitripennis]
MRNPKNIYGTKQHSTVGNNGQRNLVSDPHYLWPNKELYYEFSGQFSAKLRAKVEDALRDIMARSCVRFTPRDGQKTFVKIRETGKGCATKVGYHMEETALDLHVAGLKCHTRGTIQHEFLHALGFWHEHARPDRDRYVTVVWDNVRPGRKSNFKKKSSNETFDLGLPYDYASVMHYRYTAFSKERGMPTLVPKNKEAMRVMGQRRRVSNVDIAKLNRLYNCTGGYYRGDDLEGKKVIIGEVQELEEGEPRARVITDELEMMGRRNRSLKSFRKTKRETMEMKNPLPQNIETGNQHSEAFEPQKILPELLKGVLDNDKDRPIVIQFAIYQPIVYRTSGQNETVNEKNENTSKENVKSDSNQNKNNDKFESNNHNAQLKSENNGKRENNSAFKNSKNEEYQYRDDVISSMSQTDKGSEKYVDESYTSDSYNHPIVTEEPYMNPTTTIVQPLQMSHTSYKHMTNPKVHMLATTNSDIPDEDHRSNIGRGRPTYPEENFKSEENRYSEDQYLTPQKQSSEVFHHNFEENMPSSHNTPSKKQNSNIPIDIPTLEEDELHRDYDTDSKIEDSVALKHYDYTTKEAVFNTDDDYYFPLRESEISGEPLITSPKDSYRNKYDEFADPEKYDMPPDASNTKYDNYESSDIKQHVPNSESEVYDTDMKNRDYPKGSQNLMNDGSGMETVKLTDHQSQLSQEPFVSSRSPEHFTEYVPDMMRRKESEQNINSENPSSDRKYEQNYKENVHDRLRPPTERDDKDPLFVSNQEKININYETKHADEREHPKVNRQNPKHDLFIEEDFNDELDMEIRRRRIEQAKQKMDDKVSFPRPIVQKEESVKERQPELDDRRIQVDMKDVLLRHVPDQRREIQEVKKNFDYEEDLISKPQSSRLNLNPGQALPLNASFKLGVRRLIRKQTPAFRKQ